ncbi:MAG: M50 family metallopeptidase [Sandaracinaceae bacterium]|nr:hypothetical protein [Myxococcales bacterium]
MEFLNTPLSVAIAILGISFLVIVHESGHYLAARAFGMRVLKYSIGLGPALWKYKPKNSPTTYQVCALPLLAYVQIDGMNPVEPIDPDDDEAYANKGVFARIVTIFAGPLANYLAAALIAFCLHLVGGWPSRTLEAEVWYATKGSPAHMAEAVDPDADTDAKGIIAGDRIVQVGQTEVSDFDDLVEATTAAAGQRTLYVVEREGQRLEFMATPERVDDRGRLGVHIAGRPIYSYHTTDFQGALRAAWEKPLVTTLLSLAAIANLIERRSTDGVTSAVGMTKVLADSIEIGAQMYIALLFNLSVALGLFNLLPFPALDGGRLAFLGYEVITRRRANEKVEAAIHTVGIIFLLGVLVLVMGRDVINLTQ